MRCRYLLIGLLGLIGCVGLAACYSAVRPGADNPADNSSDVPASGDLPTDDPSDGDGGDSSESDSTSDDPVDTGSGDTPSQPDTDTDATRPEPGAGITARVRNESAYRADVTLRFIRSEMVGHLAFVRVLPDTVTTVVSPELADRLELSGVDERAGALPSMTLAYGVDFDEDTPAEYVIPFDTPDDPVPPDPDPGDVEPPTIEMLEPAEDVTVRLGSTLLVRWRDGGDVPGTVVRISLRSVDGGTAGDLLPIGPAIGAALDGLNDELVIVLEGLEPGVYEVVGQIDDGITVVTSPASGLVHVIFDPGNAAPSLTIVSPTALTELENGDSLLIAWDDEDEDDNATITFSLAATDPGAVGVGPFVISPPLAEDPDGASADSAMLTIRDVLPGLYDLVGEIDDGRLVGTARIVAVVRVLPEPENDPPQLVLIEPASDFETKPGESFRVRWTDSDANDNARISLLLDPDLETGSLDGNEILIVSSIEEDRDDGGDEITLGVPQGVVKGMYRLAGSITDGLSEVVTWAPGIIYFGVSRAEEPEEPPPPPTLTFREPSVPVKARMGDVVTVWLEAENLPPDAEVQLTLTNVPYGGDISVDVTPASLVLNEATVLALPSSEEDIANRDWPRQFDLTAGVHVDGTEYTSVAPALVWIRQEVEVLGVEMVNYTCEAGSEPVGDEREFVGLEIAWYGGGFEQREAHAEVRFWVSDDGTIPVDDEMDGRHWVIHEALESPNIKRTQRVHLFRIVGPVITGDIVNATLLRGDYQVITIVEPEGFGRIISVPHPDWIQICLRSSDE